MGRPGARGLRNIQESDGRWPISAVKIMISVNNEACYAWSRLFDARELTTIVLFTDYY